MQEHKRAITSQFITLTYDISTAPITSQGRLGLDKTHLQLFFKRLREHTKSLLPGLPPIKYFAVGEYGSRSSRPHYHIILFNSSIEAVTRSWNYGYIHPGDVRGICEASIGYCLKYISKDIKSSIPFSEDDDRIPEFALMSKGLGSNYITPEIIKYHTSDLANRMCHVLPGGKKASMCRYYKERIYHPQERRIIRPVILSKLDKDFNRDEQLNGPINWDLFYQAHQLADYQACIQAENNKFL